MMHRFVLVLLLLVPLTVAGCSGGNSGAAPEDPDGPGQAPHALDGTYLDGANHGPDAKANLRVCQACHGQPGGPGSNPRFNIGINSAASTGCEACHGINYAHPVDWAGPNDTFHYSAGTIQDACTLCHGAGLDGIGGTGDSCLGCHDSTTDFTLDCAFCHGLPPDGSADLATDTGVNHGNVAAVLQHESCVLCHGMKESDTGSSFAVTAEYLLFDKGTDTIGDHWDGWLDMNSSTGYNEADFGCNSGCHANDIDHQLSDSGLPVKSKDFGFGEAVPHPVDQTFFNPLNHGLAAKGLTAAFANGLADCRICHATQAGANLRFNEGIVSAGNNGCEGCHNDGTAHPSFGLRDKVHWYDGIYRHGDIDVTKFMTMCTLCHGVNLGGVADGGVGPACTACHTNDPLDNPSGCISCHNLPPDNNGPAGNIRPNRQGRHEDHDYTCDRCHNAAGIGTGAHFDLSSPADVRFLYSHPDDDITAVSTGDNTTCNGTCHGDPINVEHINATWYPAP